jgi:hypothetical protein
MPSHHAAAACRFNGARSSAPAAVRQPYTDVWMVVGIFSRLGAQQ